MHSANIRYSTGDIKVTSQRLTSKATLRRTSFAIQNWVYGTQATWAETIIVSLVAAGSTSEHNEVSILSAGRALFRIVLKQSKVAPRVTRVSTSTVLEKRAEPSNSSLLFLFLCAWLGTKNVLTLRSGRDISSRSKNETVYAYVYGVSKFKAAYR